MKKIKKIEGNIIQDVRNLIRLDEEIKKKKKKHITLLFNHQTSLQKKLKDNLLVKKKILKIHNLFSFNRRRSYKN